MNKLKCCEEILFPCLHYINGGNNIGYKLVTNNNWNKFLSSGNSKCYGFGKDIHNNYIHLYNIKQLENNKHKYLNKHNSNDIKTICIDTSMSNKKINDDHIELYDYISFDKNIMFTIDFISFTKYFLKNQA